MAEGVPKEGQQKSESGLRLPDLAAAFPSFSLRFLPFLLHS